MKLSEILDPTLLAADVDAGYITSRHHPDDQSLVIYNYTPAAQYDRHWTDATRLCRGLIVRLDGSGDADIVARPFAKFFNYGEHPDGSLNLSQWAVAYDKLDGSLGVIYPAPDGRPAVATRGSFTSDQAVHATTVLRERYSKVDTQAGWTDLVEIIYPSNRIVVDYGDMDDLVQIGMVNHATGHSTPSAWWSKYGMPAASRVAEGSLAEVLALPPREGKEGVVVHLADGTMVKIKQDDYVRLHRIVTGLNETTVWEALRTGTYWRLEREMPEEFRDWAWRIARPLLADHGLLVQGARQAHASAALAAPSKHYTERRTWRKEFARLANRSAYAPYIFAIEDGRDFYDMAWKAVRPKGPKPTGRTECAA